MYVALTAVALDARGYCSVLTYAIYFGVATDIVVTKRPRPFFSV